MSAQRELGLHIYILGQLAAGPTQVGVPTLGLPGPTLTQAQSVMEKTVVASCAAGLVTTEPAYSQVAPRTAMAPK